MGRNTRKYRGDSGFGNWVPGTRAKPSELGAKIMQLFSPAVMKNILGNGDLKGTGLQAFVGNCEEMEKTDPKLMKEIRRVGMISADRILFFYCKKEALTKEKIIEFFNSIDGMPITIDAEDVEFVGQDKDGRDTFCFDMTGLENDDGKKGEEGDQADETTLEGKILSQFKKMKEKSVALTKMGVDAKVVDGKLLFIVDKGKLPDSDGVKGGFAKIANDLRNICGDRMSGQKYTPHSVTRMDYEDGKEAFSVDVGNA